MKQSILGIFVFFAAIMLSSCATFRPETGITGLTIQCNGKTQPVLDCKSMYLQFVRTFRADMGIFMKNASGIGIGAKKLMSLDSITSDLINHSHELCFQLNNCLISVENYTSEMKTLRRAQLKIREVNQTVSDYEDDSEADDSDRKTVFENLYSHVIDSLVAIDSNSSTEDSSNKDE